MEQCVHELRNLTIIINIFIFSQCIVLSIQLHCQKALIHIKYSPCGPMHIHIPLIVNNRGIPTDECHLTSSQFQSIPESIGQWTLKIELDAER